MNLPSNGAWLKGQNEWRWINWLISSPFRVARPERYRGDLFPALSQYEVKLLDNLSLQMPMLLCDKGVDGSNDQDSKNGNVLRSITDNILDGWKKEKP